MTNWIKFELNGFMINAGILGLVRILHHLKAEKGKDYLFDEDVLMVRADYFKEADFANAFLDVSNEIYYKSSQVYQFERRFKIIKNELEKRNKDENYELFNENVKKNLEWLKTSNFFNQPNTTLAKGYDFLDLNKGSNLSELFKKVETIKKSKTNDSNEKLLEIYSDVENELLNLPVKQHLTAAGIGHGTLSSFYKNTFYIKESKGIISINSNSDLIECVKNDWVDNLVDYIDGEQKYSKNWICGNCSEEAVRDKAFSLSNMRSVLKDPKAKTSVFWDFNEKSSKLCDKCAFIYKLVPLGFSYIPGVEQAVFINANHSVETLVAMNTDVITDEDCLSYSTVYNKLKSQEIRKYLTLLSNMQLVIKDFKQSNYNYSFNVIGRDVLEEIVFYEEKERRDKFSSLHELSEKGVTKLSNGEFVNVYEEVINNIFNRRNHYSLFYTLMKSSFALENTYQKQLAGLVSSIQFDKNYIKGVENVKKTGHYLEMKKQARATGKAMNFVLTKSAKRVDSYSIKLLNALAVNNQDAFVTLVQRLHVVYKVEIPSIVVNGLFNPRTFKDVGNEYLLGISDIVKEKNDKDVKGGSKDE